MSRLKGYRTQIFNVLSAVGTTLLLILAALQTIDVSSFLTPQQTLAWVVFINVANIVLRQLTTGPVGGNKTEASE